MTTAEQRPRVGVASEWTLPPGWEALKSEKDNKIYYWNKKTGDTTWKFPEKEAMEHVSMVRRHTYENVRKQSNGATPTGVVPVGATAGFTPASTTPTGATPTWVSGHEPAFMRLASSSKGRSADRATPPEGRATPTGLVISPSKKRGYENVQLDTPQTIPRAHTISGHAFQSRPPHYEEVEELKPCPPVRTTSCSVGSSSQPLSPTSRSAVATPPLMPSHRILEQSMESVSPVPIQHQMSATGAEYAVVPRKQSRQKAGGHHHHHQHHQQQQQQVPQSSGELPPIPLRAFERMSSRENIADFHEGLTSPSNSTSSSITSPSALPTADLTAPPTSDCVGESVMRVSHSGGPFSMVNETALAEDCEPAPDPHAPQPYEVANTFPPLSPDSEPEVSSEQSRALSPQGNPLDPALLEAAPHDGASIEVDPPEVDPPYEEIENEDEEEGGEENGYSRVRLRPKRSSATSTAATAATPSGMRISGLDKNYDVPLNSRNMKALNVTLRRGENSSSSLLSPTEQGDYAKVGFSKEALLLRSGVTLRRNQRESLSSVVSFSKLDMEGNEEGLAGRSPLAEKKESDSSGEDQEKPQSGEAANNVPEEGMEDFKMIRPPNRPPSWVTYQRRPHAYEQLMGAVQENLDWDDSDMVSGEMPLDKGAESQSCEMIKVDENSLPRQPKSRVPHKYEDVEVGQQVTSGEQDLPSGWVAMRDEQHTQYYWHIPSGRTQYAHPVTGVSAKPTPTAGVSSDHGGVATPPSFQAQPFPAVYVGCMAIDEQNLVPGQCVKTVHDCISKMTAHMQQYSKNHKDVLLAVKGLTLFWLHPQTNAPMVAQPINRIRVWGIGLDNERDFGYVARDVTTRKHQCHVFRCSVPARAVAHLLLESHQHERHRGHRSTSSSNSGGTTPTSPTSKEVGGVNQLQISSLGHGAGVKSRRRRSLFEYFERITCTYIGSCEVGTSQGMELVNDAVATLTRSMENWQEVGVDITTSSITICDLKSGRVLGDHRVRFLCFLGIARDDRFCGYILDNGELKGERWYRFHGFMKEPNTDRLCLSLHSACQARYKRVLQAQAIRQAAAQQGGGGTGDSSKNRSAPSAIFQRLGSLKKSKKLTLSSPVPPGPPAPPPPAEEAYKTFVVQYLGRLPVSRVDGLDTVRPVVQELATSPSSRASLVDFTVSPLGLAFSNYRSSSAMSQSLSGNEFPVKTITYVVKIRTYFAFIAREAGTFVCHVFLESKVDAGTIVTTIQKMLAPPSTKSSPATPTPK